jgi:hypothetical protein
MSILNESIRACTEGAIHWAGGKAHDSWSGDTDRQVSGSHGFHSRSQEAR